MHIFTSQFIPSPGDTSVSISWRKHISFEPLPSVWLQRLVFFPNCEGSGKALSTHSMRLNSFLDDWLQPSQSRVVSVSQRTTSEYGVVLGICSQLGQIGVSSKSEIFFSGSSFLSRQGADRSVFRQAHEATIINVENVVSSSCISPSNPFPVGSNGVNGSSFARW